MLLEGRRALVTGGNTGIGKATSQRLAREGASVCVNYFGEKAGEDARQLAEELRRSGAPQAIAIEADVGEEDQVIDLVSQAVERLGGLDLLVNNAGIEKKIPLLEMSGKDWAAVIQTNLTGAFLCLREAAKVMVQSGRPGTIINMSSVHEFIPWPGFAHYCASKGGMKLLMETAARELAPQQIRVLNVAPGAIVTPINRFVLDDPEQKKQVESEIPLGHMGQPENIAAAVAWAASEEAAYVTGTTLVVDGGMSLYPKFV
ncbi:MAG TPA: glucose 1-dehydrogenase [Solirubrobacteraceae bacterium]|nr:glucose 1-dehydrogenase [Solirubrobacteraceae bacterium]